MGYPALCPGVPETKKKKKKKREHGVTRSQINMGMYCHFIHYLNFKIVHFCYFKTLFLLLLCSGKPMILAKNVLNIRGAGYRLAKPIHCHRKRGVCVCVCVCVWGGLQMGGKGGKSHFFDWVGGYVCAPHIFIFHLNYMFI